MQQFLHYGALLTLELTREIVDFTSDVELSGMREDAHCASTGLVTWLQGRDT